MFLSLLMEQLNNLFSPVTRDQRQNESVDKWMKFKGRASVVAATGTGKTYIAIKAIKRLRKRYPNLDVLVLVPTTALKTQWEDTLAENGITNNVSIQVMMGASQRKNTCELLIIDECHRISSNKLFNVFNNVEAKPKLPSIKSFGFS